MGGQGRTPSIPSSSSSRGCPDGRVQEAQRGDSSRCLRSHIPRTLPACVESPGEQGARNAGHRHSALQGTLVPLLPSSRAGSTASGAPRPLLPSVPGRDAASLSPGDAEGRPPHLPPPPSPVTEAARGAGTLAFPGSAYLALDLLHHLGCWSLTSGCKDRWKRIQSTTQSFKTRCLLSPFINWHARRACGGGARARPDLRARRCAPATPRPWSLRAGIGAGLAQAWGGAPGLQLLYPQAQLAHQLEVGISTARDGGRRGDGQSPPETQGPCRVTWGCVRRA